MAIYVALYIVGLALGVVASMALDVQLRRPGSRETVGLVFFVFLFWAALQVTHTPFTEVLLPLLWLATGILAGIGSRAARVAF